MNFVENKKSDTINNIFKQYIDQKNNIENLCHTYLSPEEMTQCIRKLIYKNSHKTDDFLEIRFKPD